MERGQRRAKRSRSAVPAGDSSLCEKLLSESEVRCVFTGSDPTFEKRSKCFTFEVSVEVCATFHLLGEYVKNHATKSGARMSVTRRDGTKVVLPRTGADQFWKLIHENFAGEDARKWKYLAMLALRENAGWPLDRIGNVFGHPKGHVTRCLTKIKQNLRDEFAASPEYLDLDCDEV